MNDYKIPSAVLKTTFNATEPNPLLATSNLVNTKTKIVGFATTTDENELIKSLQPIFYTDNQAICNSLAPKPTKSATTKVTAEPFVISDFTERILLDSDFQIVFLKWAIAILSVFVFIVSLTFICFCMMSYTPPAITIQNTNPEFYDRMKFNAEKRSIELGTIDQYRSGSRLDLEANSNVFVNSRL